MPAKTRKPVVCLPAADSTEPESRLPANLQVSLDEAATLMRVLRFLRRRRCWMGPFIDWLVAQENNMEEGSNIVPIKAAQDMLKDIQGLLSWEDKIEEWGKDAAGKPLRAFFGQTFFPDEHARESRDAINLAVADEATQFTELVRLWRLEHPEPQPDRRAYAPSGRTQRQEDPNDYEEDE